VIDDIEEYFKNGCGRCSRFATPRCSTRQWRSGLLELRQICIDSGLQETVKWGHPCYVRGRRNIAIIGALRNEFRLSFFEPALLQDEKKLLERAGPNTPNADIIRFKSNSTVAILKPVIELYLAEAIGYADRGIRAPASSDKLILPAELLDAFKSDAELEQAFIKLTPGRQKSYVINLAAAKKSQTRVARIAKHRLRILAGKGLNER